METREEGYWQAPKRRPRNKQDLNRHRIIYTTQVLRIIAEAGNFDHACIKPSFDFLLATSCGAPLFDVGLKALVFQAFEKAGIGDEYTRLLLREVSPITGFVELGRRRQGAFFDALTSFEIICSLREDDIEMSHDKINSLLAYLRRLAVDCYKLGPDVSHWAWFMALLSRIGRPEPIRVLDRFCEDLLNLRNPDRCWSPPKPVEVPKITPPIVTDIMTTAHVLINLAELQPFFSLKYVDDLLCTPLEWLSKGYDGEKGWPNADGSIDPYLTALCLRVFLRCSVLPTSERIRSLAGRWLELDDFSTAQKYVKLVIKSNWRHMMNKKVFIVHGHDESAKYEFARLIEKEFGLEVIILHEQPNYGSMCIMDKFERYAAQCDAAFILLTPDDAIVSHDNDSDSVKSYRARQNVIFELGYFIAKLGKDRVFLLHNGDIEIPSDVSGILYIPFNKIQDAFLPIKKELEALRLI